MSKMYLICGRTLLLAGVLAVTALLSCAGGGNPVDSEQQLGMVEIRARIVSGGLSKSAAVEGAAATVAERLVLEFSGDGLSPTRVEHRLDFSRPTVVDTIRNVPVGRNRRVEMWAIDAGGNVTHIDSVESRTLNIEPGIVSTVFATLIPAAGSIYLQLIELPTGTRVYASFTADDGTVIAAKDVDRAVRTFVNLDNIPHQTSGTLRVFIVKTSDNDTTHIATRELTFNARGDNAIELRFVENSGMLEADVTIYEPGVTLASYSFGRIEAEVEETGGLIITEIMWSASGDNYIELYNPVNAEAVFETLTTDVNGTASNFTNVTVAANGYLVIGRNEQAHIDIAGDLPIVSTAGSGNWVSVKSGAAVLDRVIFATGSSNGVGWPGMSTTARRSIELIKDKYDAIENNYGKNWKTTASTAPITVVGANALFGTPGY